MKTKILRVVYLPNMTLGGIHTTQVGQAAPMRTDKPPRPLEHPMVITNAAGITPLLPVEPTNGSILGIAHLP